MFSKTNKSPIVRPSPSIIGGDCSLTGDIDSQGEVHVDGKVIGDVRCSFLVIGEQGSVTGEIDADVVRVLGCVTGQISAKSVELAKSARIIGDITHDSLSVEAGAYVEGRFNRLTTMKALESPDSSTPAAEKANTAPHEVAAPSGQIILLSN